MEPVCIVYGYIGTGSLGLQHKKQTKGIEDGLYEAMVSAKLLPSRAFSPGTGSVYWTQATWTRRDVHAAAQVLSCCVQVPKGKKLKDLPELINNHISSKYEIKVFSVLGCKIEFMADSCAGGVHYSYLMPFSALAEPTLEHLESLRELFGHGIVKNEGRRRKPNFRGLHHYGSYTEVPKREPMPVKQESEGLFACLAGALVEEDERPPEPPLWRRVLDFSVSDPFDLDGEKYILWTVVGLSFGAAQVLKMLAVVLAYSHGLMTVEEFGDTFGGGWMIPMVPADGLFVDKVEYEQVLMLDRSRKVDRKKVIDLTQVRPEVENWKRTVLFPHIQKIFSEKDVFGTWKKLLFQFPPMPCPMPDFSEAVRVVGRKDYEQTELIPERKEPTLGLE